MNGILSSISNLLRGGEARATIGGLTPRIQVDLAEVPKYPPYHPGLPAVTPDQIADSQDELIDRVRGAVAVSNEDFDRTYLAAIKNYAAFVHLFRPLSPTIIEARAVCFDTAWRQPCTAPCTRTG